MGAVGRLQIARVTGRHACMRCQLALQQQQQRFHCNTAIRFQHAASFFSFLTCTLLNLLKNPEEMEPGFMLFSKSN
jgi:hypothetical protein